MKILCIGDVVGEPGRMAIKKLLPGLKSEFDIELTIVNAENSAGGSGVTPRQAKELFADGCDILTTGDHIWDRQEIKDYLDENPNIIRPANFPDGAPGRGYCISTTPLGKKVAIINLLGRVFMRYNVNCPFRALEAIVKQVLKDTPVIILDMHAETTSEKRAMGFFSDGTISAVFGTHTHVQTSDETVLPKGTAYITDLGMTGPHDSVIGQNKDRIISRFLTSMPAKFEVATDDIWLNGIVLDIEEATGKAKSIVRIQRKLIQH